MSFVIYKMELKRNFKSFLIWSLSLAGILFLGMMFFPAINQDGLLSQMDLLFENPMMSGMMKAFGVADISSLGNLMGFYVTYNSIYNILLGCIFASILASNLLAKEEANKTAEFLFTRPVSRSVIFWSKSAVMITYLLLFSLVFFLVSVVAMEFVKGDSQRELDISKRQKILLINQIKTHPAVLYEAFNLDESSFDSYSLTFASNLLSSSNGELEEMDLNMEDMNKLLEEASLGTEAFFDNVEASPDKYMKLFNVPEEGKIDFLQNIADERAEYLVLKESFFSSPDLFVTYMLEDPSLALSQFSSVDGSMRTTLELLDMNINFEYKIFKQYSAAKLAQISTYLFLLLCTISSIVLAISLMVKRGKSSMGLALGLVFFFYFINSLHGMAKNFSSIVSKIGYISPFTWMDSDVYRMGYIVEFWRVALFVGVTTITLVVGNRLLKKKDILV